MVIAYVLGRRNEAWNFHSLDQTFVSVGEKEKSIVKKVVHVERQGPFQLFSNGSQEKYLFVLQSNDYHMLAFSVFPECEV